MSATDPVQEFKPGDRVRLGKRLAMLLEPIPSIPGPWVRIRFDKARRLPVITVLPRDISPEETPDAD